MHEEEHQPRRKKKKQKRALYNASCRFLLKLYAWTKRWVVRHSYEMMMMMMMMMMTFLGRIFFSSKKNISSRD
tara:strand:+ start:106 stop:324 length:219 start_codon:yes stop_codon:yes gene_type:complete